MQIITNEENKVLILIQNNLDKYPESITYDTIKEMLNISETKLMDLLHSLTTKEFIKLDEKNKKVHYMDINKKTEVVKDNKALKQYLLNKTEEDAYNIIQTVVKKYDNYVPRYILEGSLLYGTLHLTPKKTYNIIVSLENRKLLKRVEKTDGDYYTI